MIFVFIEEIGATWNIGYINFVKRIRILEENILRLF